MITLIRANEICDNKLLGLNEDFRQRAWLWLEKLKAENINPLIYCGFRSFTDQNKLYAIGRTVSGKIVTYAKEGQSYHNYGLAFDWVPLREVSKNAGFWESDWDNENAYKIGASIGHDVQVVPIKWETGHLQDGRYKTFRDIPTKGYFKIMQNQADDFPPVQQKQSGIKKIMQGWMSR